MQSASAVPPVPVVDDSVDGSVDDRVDTRLVPFLPAGPVTRANPPGMMRAQS